MDKCFDRPSLTVRQDCVIPGIVDVHRHGAYGENQIIPQRNWMSYPTLAYVMVNGRIFEASTMDEVGNPPMKRKRFWWEKWETSR